MSKSLDTFKRMLGDLLKAREEYTIDDEIINIAEKRHAVEIPEDNDPPEIAATSEKGKDRRAFLEIKAILFDCLKSYNQREFNILMSSLSAQEQAFINELIVNELRAGKQIRSFCR